MAKKIPGKFSQKKAGSGMKIPVKGGSKKGK